MFGSSQQDSLLAERRKDSSTCSWLVETGLARRDQQSRLDRALRCNGKGWWNADASVRFSGWRLCDDRPCFGRALIPASAIHRQGLLTLLSICGVYGNLVQDCHPNSTTAHSSIRVIPNCLLCIPFIRCCIEIGLFIYINCTIFTQQRRC